MPIVIPFAGLPGGSTFEGYLHEDAGASFFLVNMPPGHGPALHRHPYAEVFVVQQGQARFTVADEELDVAGGHVVVVPTGTPHKFVNSGTQALETIAIHAAEKMVTEWLED